MRDVVDLPGLNVRVFLSSRAAIQKNTRWTHCTLLHPGHSALQRHSSAHIHGIVEMLSFFIGGMDDIRGDDARVRGACLALEPCLPGWWGQPVLPDATQPNKFCSQSSIIIMAARQEWHRHVGVMAGRRMQPHCGSCVLMMALGSCSSRSSGRGSW